LAGFLPKSKNRDKTGKRKNAERPKRQTFLSNIFSSQEISPRCARRKDKRYHSVVRYAANPSKTSCGVATRNGGDWDGVNDGNLTAPSKSACVSVDKPTLLPVMLVSGRVGRHSFQVAFFGYFLGEQESNRICIKPPDSKINQIPT
jgi:hypothetical protein